MQSLTTGIEEDGFLSRLLTIHFDGDVPYSNENYLEEQEKYKNSPMLTGNYFKGMIENALPFQSPIAIGKEPITVQFSSEVKTMFREYENDTKDLINATPKNDSFTRSLYNRAPLNTLKVASLLAVADHYLQPVINENHFEWAMKLVDNHIIYLKGKNESGDIGTGDQARVEKVKSICESYLKTKNPKMETLRSLYIIPRSFIQSRITGVSSFKNHKSGMSNALNATIKELIDNGYLREVSNSVLEKTMVDQGCIFPPVLVGKHFMIDGGESMDGMEWLINNVIKRKSTLPLIN